MNRLTSSRLLLSAAVLLVCGIVSGPLITYLLFKYFVWVLVNPGLLFGLGMLFCCAPLLRGAETAPKVLYVLQNAFVYAVLLALWFGLNAATESTSNWLSGLLILPVGAAGAFTTYWLARRTLRLSFPPGTSWRAALIGGLTLSISYFGARMLTNLMEESIVSEASLVTVTVPHVAWQMAVGLFLLNGMRVPVPVEEQL